MRLLKTITLLLFLTLLVAFTLSGTILQLYQAHARYVMEEKLELESLVTVNNLNPSSITWIKKGINKGNKEKQYQMYFCAKTISLKFKEPAHKTTLIIIKPIDTS